ncbi:hypothetical protein [Anaerostipes hominis (ex Lee et al. 2021)]|uniref:hypothetical protein n=1 Tax=Anaerostipes hominis (ex Lee et al. 2021) TaxID=2025494 RepID=UPI0022DF2735|nr:hypothetical protein [Anaerostipes hominis (ex Lee et al. 2021)]
MAEIDLGKVVGPQGEPGIKGDTGKDGPQGPPGPEGVVDGNSTITFVTPEAYQEPQSGDSVANLFGRFKRWILNLQDNLGPLSSLKTPDKSSAVAAVNANYDSIAQLEEDVGNSTDLTTTSKEVVGAVNEINSDLDTTKSTLNSYISTHKIQKTTVRNYAIGTGLSITPSSNSRLALITPTFGNINSFAYNVQILPVVPNSNTLTIQWLAKNDGTIVRSGNVDLEIMLFPWE